MKLRNHGARASLAILIAFTIALPLHSQVTSTRDNNTKALLGAYLDQQADSGFAFSVLVAVDGKVLIKRGYGWTDPAHTTAASEQTLFNIASITKSFTAIAIFKLRDNHQLSLGDSLPMFFEHVPVDKQSITISQLLTHASGFQQHYMADGCVNRDMAVTRILSDTLKFAPGSSFSYSNENFELLGAIIEQLTHQPYEDAIRTLILQPAKLAETRFWAEELDSSRQTVASKNRAIDSAMLVRNWGYIASGGMYSDLTDLFKWITTLTRGSLLNRKSLDEMWTVQRSATTTGIGYGWFVSVGPLGKEIWTRGTEDWGHNGVVRWFPDRNAIIIVQSNSGERGDKNDTANRYISEGILKILQTPQPR